MNCFICNEALTETTASDEHIILNSLGGHLHSKELLCKKCNSKFGKQADAALAETLKFAASQLNIKRCRGENQTIQTADDEKYDLAPGCKPVLKKPEIKMEKQADGTMKIEMSARSTQEARKLLKSLQKQYPAIDIEKVMAQAERRKKFVGSPVGLKIGFDGDQIFPSVVKTAVEFYLLRGGKRKQIAHLIPYLMEEQELSVCWYYYPEKPVVSLDETEICHVICVTGDPEQGILYGYVDLFGILQCLVLLNDRYSGDKFFESYVYEVNQAEEIGKIPDIRLDRDEVQKIVQGNETSWAEGLKQQMILFQRKAGKIVEARVSHAMWERAMDNSLKKYPEGVLISEEMIKELKKELEKEIIPWYVSRICKEEI